MRYKFRILKDWKIIYSRSKKYVGQCTVNVEKQIATIYPWETYTKEPSDYKLHELLHCSLKALSKKKGKEYREAEETLIQDICTIFKKKK
jgi:hypothetical protein